MNISGVHSLVSFTVSQFNVHVFINYIVKLNDSLDQQKSKGMKPTIVIWPKSADIG